ncbi:hypothetical protein C8Q76DRAFT_610480, partial [Earliella scabrosa]
AVFHTAAVWRWSSHLETGNFVPRGETAPGRLPESRMHVFSQHSTQTTPSNLCQIEYVISTEHDATIFEYQAKIEALMATIPSFNRANKDRRRWQTGEPPYNTRFSFSAQLFMRKPTVATAQPPPVVSYELHPWIRQAVERSDWMPNPYRPRLFACTSGQLQDISEATPPYIKRDDIVWIAFRIHIIIGADSWMPAFIPLEIIRVDTVPAALASSSDFGYAPEIQPVERTLIAGRTFVIGRVPSLLC